MNKDVFKNKIDKKALHFCVPLASVFDTIEDTEKAEGMDMLLYSGGVIPNHFYWQNLSISLDGMKLTKELYPILLDHETSKKIGFCDSPTIKDNALYMENIKFVDTEESYEFRRLSKQGFPYQASLYGVPTKVEVVEEGEFTIVNGQKLEGPGHVWKEWELREGSACVFGYDSNTESKAFAENDKVEVEYKFAITHNSKLKDGEPKWSTYLTTENRNALPDSAFADKKNRKYPHHWISDGVMYLHRGGLAAARSRAAQQDVGSSIQAHLKAHAKAIGMGEEKNKKKKEKLMEFDINKFAEKQPEAYAKFVEGIVAEAVKEAVDKLSVEHIEKANALTVELAAVTEKFIAAEKENLSFKKEAAILAQNALVTAAETLWATKLAESDLPENLHEKVKMHVSHEKFVGDEGLDSEAFGVAIDEEIADWADKGITSTVLGSGFSQKKVDDDKENANKLNKETDEQAEALLKLI